MKPRDIFSSGDGRYSKRFSTVFFLLCFGLILYAFYKIFIPFAAPLAWALILSSVFFPFYRRIEKILGNRSGLSSLLMIVLISVLIIFPVLWMLLLLAGQSIDAYHSIEKALGDEGFDPTRLLSQTPWLKDMWDWVHRLLGLEQIDWKSALLQAMKTISGFLVDQSTNLLGQLAGFIFDFMIMLTAMYYFFKDGRGILSALRELDPLPQEYEEKLIGQFSDVCNATLYGSLMTALCQGILGGLLFGTLGISGALLWGALMGFLSLFPAVGSFLVWMPAGVYQLVAGSTWKGVVILVFGAAVISSLDNFLKPYFIRGKSDMHTLLVFLSAFGGIQVFGFLGLVLGPLISALFLTFLQFYKIEFQSVLPEIVPQTTAVASADSIATPEASPPLPETDKQPAGKPE